MTRNDNSSASSLASLVRDYRAIRAPGFIATRLRTGIEGRPTRRPGRRPLFAGVAIAAVCVLAILPFMHRQEPVQAPVSISLTTYSLGMPALNLSSTPGLAQLKSVRTPVLPARPVLKKIDKPRIDTDVHWRHESPKEKTHEIT